LADLTEAESKLLEHIHSPALKKSIVLAREAAEKVWDADVPRLISYYTDHGPKHLARVAGLAAQLLTANRGRKLSETETYLLLCGVYFHDLGMQCDPRKHTDVVDLAIRHLGADASLREFRRASGPLTSEEQKTLRRNHHLLSAAWMRWSRESSIGVLAPAALSIPVELVADVEDICRFHTSLSVRSCDRWSESDQKTRKRMIAAVLRLADELDIAGSRVSDPQTIREFALDPQNEVYWWLHSCTEIKFQPNNLLLLTFELAPENESLADSVREGFLDRFRAKNQECMTVLGEEEISVYISPDSNVVYDPDAPTIPESIVLALQKVIETPPRPTSRPLERRQLDVALLTRLQVAFDECDSAADFVDVLGLLDGLEAGSLRTRGGAIETMRVKALNVLQAKTSEEPEATAYALVGQVLPRCLCDDSPEQEDGKFTAYLYRKRLTEWLRAYPAHILDGARTRLIKLLSVALFSSAQESAIWTIARIGFRSETVVNDLWQVASSAPESVQDTALSAITHLGIPDTGRRQMVSMLNQALQAGRVSVPLWGALDQLRDPGTIEALRNAWLLQGIQRPPSQAYHALHILAHIAAAQPNDAQLQNTTWRITSDYMNQFERYLHSFLFLHSDIAPLFDTEDVVFHLVSLLGRQDNSPVKEGRRARDLICRRLLDCCRPHQVQAWLELTSQHRAALRPLLDDTCIDSQVANRSQTELGLLKVVAWRVLLRAGTPELLSPDYFENCILGEASPYLHGGAFEWLACFRLDPLPAAAVALVVEEYDEARDAFPPQFPDRMGATRLLQSAATWEAFDALSRFGYTYMGKVLLDSINALSVVSLYLSQTERPRVRERLLDTALHADQARHRTAAIEALHDLGAAGYLLNVRPNEFIEALHADEISSDDRGRLVRTLGHISRSHLPSALIEELIGFAQSQDDDILRWSSLEALARLGVLTGYLDSLSGVIGLRQDAGTWHLTEAEHVGSEVALVIALLYETDHVAFGSALGELLASADGEALDTASDAVRVIHSRKRKTKIPSSVSNALLGQLGRAQSPWVPVERFIEIAALVCPDELACVDWSRLIGSLAVRSLVALADALGGARFARAATRKKAVGCLLELTREADYAVRRSAFRALQLQDQTLHARLCKTWASSAEPALRQRAAEAGVWVASNDCSGDGWPAALLSLSWDPEPGVREAMARARDERLRITWSSSYLERVLSLNDYSNETILSYWACASALAQIGNDDTLQRIRSHLASEPLPAHAVTWLNYVFKQTSEQWTEAVKKWPGPIPKWTRPLG